MLGCDAQNHFIKVKTCVQGNVTCSHRFSISNSCTRPAGISSGHIKCGAHNHMHVLKRCRI